VVLKPVTDTVGGTSVGLRFSFAHAEPARDNCRMQRERARDGEKYFMSGEKEIVGGRVVLETSRLIPRQEIS